MRSHRHHHVLGPRPLPEGQSVLRPRQGGDEPAGVRGGRGATATRRDLAGRVARLDAYRADPCRPQDRRAALARAARARAHWVAALPRPRGGQSRRGPPRPGEERRCAPGGGSGARVWLHRPW